MLKTFLQNPKLNFKFIFLVVLLFTHASKNILSFFPKGIEVTVASKEILKTYLEKLFRALKFNDLKFFERFQVPRLLKFAST